MNFSEQKPIYLQIADWLCEQILLGKIKSEERILSLRELASQLEVNPNTVMRAYDMLQEMNIITCKRGMGYFATNEAMERITELHRQRFIDEELPKLFHTMKLLHIDIDTLVGLYQNNSSEL